MMFALVLSASRTGFVCVVLLAAWGALDRGLSRSARVGLLLAPLAYLLFWGGLALWAHETHHIFGGEARVNESNDSPNSRLNIWSNAIALIRQHPWSGVGFGEFNFAWSLTPFPHRPTAFFDHTHNIVLQFAVELGLPLAALVLLLMAYALWRAFVAGRRAPDAQGLLLRSAFMMVLLMVVHSMLEYPLWYAYFLLPTAFAFGLCLGTPGESASGLLPVPAAAGPVRRVATVGALLLMLAGVASVFDYLRVSAVFAESGPPLAQRIANGQRSWLFAQHADYAAATTADHPSEAMASFKVATHYLLDTRLMIAWANALNESGDVERARYIAQRLREFRNDDAKPFFAPCDEPGQSGEPLPFQCTPPSRSFDYRDFR